MGDNKGINCEIIEDLMYLVKTNHASEISKRLIHEHIMECENCKKEYDLIDHNDKSDMKRRGCFNLLRENMNVIQMLFILLIIAEIILTSGSANVFTNVLIMPCIGIISVFLFKKRFYLIPVIAFFTEVITEIVKYYGEDISIFSRSIYGIIYIILITIGIAIALLLRYGLSRK